MLSMALYFAITLFYALSWSPRAVMGQGDTTCKTTSLDWYTSVVGETPCAYDPNFKAYSAHFVYRPDISITPTDMQC